MVKSDFYRIHSDIGVDLATAWTNPVKVALAHKNPTTTEALPPYLALPSPPFHYPCHFIYLIIKCFHYKNNHLLPVASSRLAPFLPRATPEDPSRLWWLLVPLLRFHLIVKSFKIFDNIMHQTCQIVKKNFKNF